MTGPPGHPGEHGEPGLRGDPVSGGGGGYAALIQGLVNCLHEHKGKEQLIIHS